MPNIQDTAYPRLKEAYTPRELAEWYTPTPDELLLVTRLTKTLTTKVCCLLALKTVQRLGYFLPLSEIPLEIVRHIAGVVGLTTLATDVLGRYDQANTSQRHRVALRAHMQIVPYGAAARRVVVRTLGEAARTKHELADLINVVLEELVRQRYELPAFRTLARAAQRIRAAVTHRLYRQVFAALGDELRERLATLFVADPTTRRTPWNELKADPGQPTLTHLQDLIDRLTYLQTVHVGAPALVGILDVKLQHFAAEARTLDAARMVALEPFKQATLAAAYLAVQAAQAHDDLAEMFIRRMQTIHQKGREALLAYRAQYQQRTDGLIGTLRAVVTAYRRDGEPLDRLAAIDAVIGDRSESVLAACDAHLAYAGNNYFPLLWACYTSHRSTLFRLLRTLTLRSTSQNTALEDAVAFLLRHEQSKRDWLPTVQEEREGKRFLRWAPLVDLSWVPEGWWRLLTEQHSRATYPRHINRRHFEVCVFSQILLALKAGDLAVIGSAAFADYRDQLISLEAYAQSVTAYGHMVGFPITGDAFVAQLQAKLAATAQATDDRFPTNHAVRIEQGEPILTRAPKQPEPEGLPALEALIAPRLRPVNILDVLIDTEHWLNWTRCFGPISGHDGKLDEPVAAYLTTVFGYGCQLGPSQVARSLGVFDRRQIAWVNLRHITADTLELASREVINAYRRFALPRCWGSGKRVSADGTKWDLYAQNLLSEYHLRYGDYGGIGYYHVADTYIALFSHFIPCGVWEAVYILDGLLKQQSDYTPDTIHADTQGQSEAVFGLATLFGIELLPRIRNWKHLKCYRPTREVCYAHIDDLFCDVPINWTLIAAHLPDMLRVVLSIKAGRLIASTVLRRLNSYSTKNKLYHAFCELGRVIRTDFLLRYVADEELRTTIHAATNKSEAFNAFVQWIAFGGDGTIRENDRLEQQKIIRYNQLVANCVIFYNVHAVSEVLHVLQQEGQVIDAAALAALSPYMQHHIDRFGHYHLDLSQQPPAIEYDRFTLPAAAGSRTSALLVQQPPLWTPS